MSDGTSVATESPEFYKDLVETLQVLVWQVDSQGRFTFLNPAWEKCSDTLVMKCWGGHFPSFNLQIPCPL